MLFFGFHMLLARVPDKKAFSNFLISRRLMGSALLILAANYSVHLFLGIRLKDVTATILMNMATYFICYWLFGSAMMKLLDHSYVTLRRFMRHTAMWLTYATLAFLVSVCLDGSRLQCWVTAALALWVVTYGLFLSFLLLRTYSRAIRNFEHTQSDDIGAYIRWMSVFTYWAIGFGVGCSLLTFLPDKYVFVWVLSSIPFYIYLYCCYQNYLLFHEKVESAIREKEEANPGEAADTAEQPAYHQEIARRIANWIQKEGYCQPGITLNQLALLLCTNRTYLSGYINRVYQVSFRDWIADLRIGYAKQLMTKHPQMKIQEISETSGFLSISHFSRTFSEKEKCSPARWRKERMK